MKLKFIIESLEYVLDILMSYLVPFNRLLEFENSSFISVCNQYLQSRKNYWDKVKKSRKSGKDIFGRETGRLDLFIH